MTYNPDHDPPVGYVANHGRTHMSARMEGLQLAWDATSMSSLLKCPRRYQYEHLEGWHTKSIHLEAGKYIATALEAYQKERAAGTAKEDAILDVLHAYLIASYGDAALGHYESQWHCTADKPRKVMVDGKARYRKCPNALSGVWWPVDENSGPPHICGECGAPTAVERHFIPGDKAKNRLTIAMALLAYMDEQAEDAAHGIVPYVFPNGTPAVELSFNVPFPARTAPTGESYSLCGHMDYIGVFGDEVYISDNKTTGKYLDDKFFTGYSPSIQFDTYDLVGTLLWPELDHAGVQVDALQISATSQASGRRTFYKTDEMRNEHMRTIMWVLDQAEKYARDRYWPMNKASCTICPFRTVCSLPESERQYALEADDAWEKREPWNPTITR